MDAKKIYKKLLAHFGPQGWWPIFDKTSKSCRYFTVGLPKPYSRFEICVGAILTQNTAWKNVEKALYNLHSAAPRSEALASTTGVIPDAPNAVEGQYSGIQPQVILSCKNLEALIQPAGYYNQKAKKLRIFSAWWQKNIPTILTQVRQYSWNQRTIKLREKLLGLWGIGKETADSMLLYAFDRPIFVIDAYTKRLCYECGAEFKTYDEYRHFFESQLPKSTKLFNEYHALVVAWGKLHSKDKQSAVKIIK